MPATPKNPRYPGRFGGGPGGSLPADPAGPMVRLSVTMPPPLAAQLREHAKATGRAVSAVVAEAVKSALEE